MEKYKPHPRLTRGTFTDKGAHMANRDKTKHKPIGYWLKHADDVITEHIDRVLGENGFTSSRWQVLNIAYQADTITGELPSTPCRHSSTHVRWTRSSRSA